MLKALLVRARLGHGTRPPGGPLQEGIPGRPVFKPQLCREGCAACVAACPTRALEPGRLDLGRCILCTDCARACPAGAVEFTSEPAMATRRREDLVLEGEVLRLAEALEERSRRLFGRSLRLRQVSAGGCNGCEVESNVLGTPAFDLGRFGIGFVASPRHADGILVTGPVTRNMEAALLETWRAVPAPRLVIATGACAISGGPFEGSPEVRGGLEGLLPVDLYIPGCPPHPLTTLDGLLRLLGREEASAHGGAGGG